MSEHCVSMTIRFRIDGIKVADFGLSVDVYSRNYFREKKEGEDEGEAPAKLPIRWMALASLNDGIFKRKRVFLGEIL